MPLIPGTDNLGSKVVTVDYKGDAAEGARLYPRALIALSQLFSRAGNGAMDAVLPEDDGIIRLRVHSGRFGHIEIEAGVKLYAFWQTSHPVVTYPEGAIRYYAPVIRANPPRIGEGLLFANQTYPDYAPLTFPFPAIKPWGVVTTITPDAFFSNYEAVFNSARFQVRNRKGVYSPEGGTKIPTDFGKSDPFLEYFYVQGMYPGTDGELLTLFYTVSPWGTVVCRRPNTFQIVGYTPIPPEPGDKLDASDYHIRAFPDYIIGYWFNYPVSLYSGVFKTPSSGSQPCFVRVGSLHPENGGQSTFLFDRIPLMEGLLSASAASVDTNRPINGDVGLYSARTVGSLVAVNYLTAANVADTASPLNGWEYPQYEMRIFTSEGIELARLGPDNRIGLLVASPFYPRAFDSSKPWSSLIVTAAIRTSYINYGVGSMTVDYYEHKLVYDGAVFSLELTNAPLYTAYYNIASPTTNGRDMKNLRRTFHYL